MGKSCQTTQDEPGLTVHFLFQCTTMVQETNTQKLMKSYQVLFLLLLLLPLKSLPDFKNAIN